MNKSAFLITKPLQYINCTNIEDNNIKVCLLCNNFSDINSFFLLIKKSNSFNEFLLFKSRFLALIYVCFYQRRYNKLYIDSDFGLIVRFLLLLLYSTDVFTYEEGYASYTYLRRPNSFINKFLLKISNFLKIKNWSGGSCKVKGVYLYDHDFFKKSIKLESYDFLKNFKKSFIDNIINSSEFRYLSAEIDFTQFKNKKLVIYLSYYSYSNELLTLLQKYPEHYKILKLHPQLDSMPEQIISNFDYIIPKNLLVEYFLLKVIETSESTHIIHHASFALHYLDNCKINNVTQEILKLPPKYTI